MRTRTKDFRIRNVRCYRPAGLLIAPQVEEFTRRFMDTLKSSHGLNYDEAVHIVPALVRRALRAAVLTCNRHTYNHHVHTTIVQGNEFCVIVRWRWSGLYIRLFRVVF